LKLTLRTRFRLFFWGAVRELAVASAAMRELRQYRDGLNGLVDGFLNAQPPVPNVLYIMVDSRIALNVIEHAYGVDHPYTLRMHEVIGHISRQAQVAPPRLN
jgi:hypothetical protein